MSSKSGLNAAPSTHPAQPTCGDRTTIAVRLPIHRPAMYRSPIVTEQALYILASLARGECHGYGIARDAEELSGGRVRLSAGTLYGALNRLADDGLVEPAGEQPGPGPTTPLLPDHRAWARPPSPTLTSSGSAQPRLRSARASGRPLA